MAEKNACPETCSKMQFQYFEMMSSVASIKRVLAEENFEEQAATVDCSDDSGSGRNKTKLKDHQSIHICAKRTRNQRRCQQKGNDITGVAV